VIRPTPQHRLGRERRADGRAAAAPICSEFDHLYPIALSEGILSLASAFPGESTLERKGAQAQ
jgi:hypothetical protein